VLIKKKDVNDYFAARRNRHAFTPKEKSAVATATSSKVKRDCKASGTATPVDMLGSSAPILNSYVPPFTTEGSLIDARPPDVKRWTKL
jgi:hypothetical protein